MSGTIDSTPKPFVDISTKRGIFTCDFDGQTYLTTFHFDYYDFCDFLRGKKVLDLASGCAMLSQDALRLGLDVQISSLDPAYKHQFFRPSDLHNLDSMQQQKFFHNLVAGYSNDLSMFEDGIFDLVVDSYGLGFYCDSQINVNGRVVFDQSIAEIVRVLKPGGEAWFAPCPFSFNGLLQETINKLKLDVQVLKQEEVVRIIKPKPNLKSLHQAH